MQDVRSLAPDLILLGGDFVTYGEGTDYDNMLSLFRQLSEIAPVCGVLGNHEDELYFLDNDRELVEKFTAAGVTVLRNEEARYTVHDNVISILGVEGSPADFSNYGASTFMDSVEPQTDYDLRICLAHVPPTFPSIWKIIPLSWVLPGTPTAASCVCRRSVRFIPPRRLSARLCRRQLYACQQRHPHCKPGTGRFQPGAPHQQCAGAFGH